MGTEFPHERSNGLPLSTNLEGSVGTKGTKVRKARRHERYCTKGIEKTSVPTCGCVGTELSAGESNGLLLSANLEGLRVSRYRGIGASGFARRRCPEAGARRPSRRRLEVLQVMPPQHTVHAVHV